MPRPSNAGIRARLACTNCPPGLRADLLRAVRRTALVDLPDHATRDVDLSIALVSDAEIADLNQRWLGHEGPTDVITFDLREAPDPALLEAEIVISLDTARREARHRGHSWRSEILLYVVHAVLHLLGYDDHRAAEHAAMHRLEDRILADLGIGPVYARRDVGPHRDRKTRSKKSRRR